jgi:hypothetical protein
VTGCGYGRCGRDDTRLYPCGRRCASHTPAALAGKPEPDTGRYCPPAICYCGGCGIRSRPPDPAADTVVDLDAIKSGKRRSTPEAFRDAQAQTRRR